MAIPKKVLEQAEEAERLAHKAGMKGAPEPADKPDETPKETAKQEKGKPDNTPAQKTKVDPEDYKERFARQKVKYDQLVHEANTLRESNLKLTGQIEVLQRQVTELAEQRQNTQQANVPVTPVKAGGSMLERITSALTEQEKENYSPEFLAMLGRIIETAAPKTDPDLVEKVNSLEKSQHETKEDRFWRLINEAVPNWASVQDTDEFQDYLRQYDRKLKMTNGAALTKAQEQLDAETAIAVFEDFKVPEQTTPPPTDPREKHIHPDTGGSADSSDIGDVGNVYTEKEIADFYQKDAIRAGKGLPQTPEAAATERAIRKQIEAANNNPR